MHIVLPLHNSSLRLPLLRRQNLYFFFLNVFTVVEASISSQKCSLMSFAFPKVWAITDSKRQGFLGFTEFIAAMQVRFILFPWIAKSYSLIFRNLTCRYFFHLQLVSLAQAGHEITHDILNSNGGLLQFILVLLCALGVV